MKTSVDKNQLNLPSKLNEYGNEVYVVNVNILSNINLQIFGDKVIDLIKKFIGII